MAQQVPERAHLTVPTAGGEHALVAQLQQLFQQYGLAINSLIPDVITFESADATPSVLGGHKFKTAGTTAITDFDDGVVGQTIKIQADASITVTDNAAIILAGSVNFDMVADDTLTLTMYNDQVWHEDGRNAVGGGGATILKAVQTADAAASEFSKFLTRMSHFPHKIDKAL